MKTNMIRLLIAFAVFAVASASYAAKYVKNLCQEDGYICYKVQKGDTWEALYPDEEQRDVVKRINRTNQKLRAGQTIALPDHDVLDHIVYAPFEREIAPYDGKAIVIDLSDLAFGAYDENGVLQKWGPISGGKNWCSDVGRGCRTPVGSYEVYSRRGANCVSYKFPIGKGGAPMPYCMFFKGGFAMHGSPKVPGYHASHGCVRMFTEDAKWIDREFSNGEKLKVIIRH